MEYDKGGKSTWSGDKFVLLFFFVLFWFGFFFSVFDSQLVESVYTLNLIIMYDGGPVRLESSPAH